MFFKLFFLLLFTLTNSNFVSCPTINIKTNKIIPYRSRELYNCNFNEFQEQIGKVVVKSLSNTLPQFDSISHIVLTTNSKLISYVLAEDYIPTPLKKNIILLAIKLTQEGDNTGSHILELYYKIVDYIL
tara:strand:- start:1033 stop:1419 length:387 start_codon:yes stop_codon:yes gene_type:complete